MNDACEVADNLQEQSLDDSYCTRTSESSRTDAGVAESKSPAKDTASIPEILRVETLLKSCLIPA